MFRCQSELLCPVQDEERFVMSSVTEEGRDKCPYGPTTGYTGLIIGKTLQHLAITPRVWLICSWVDWFSSRPAAVHSLSVWVSEFSRYSPQLSFSHTEDRRCSHTLAEWWECQVANLLGWWKYYFTILTSTNECFVIHYFFLSHTEADFVGSALVRESESSSTGDDDKIYFFFTEKSQEETAMYSHSRVARVARVCKVRAYFWNREWHFAWG